jgi:hypothetical protein
MDTTEHGSHAVATEPDRVSTRVVVGFAILLTAIGAAAAILIFVLFRGLERVSERQDAATVAAEGVERPLDRLPPRPRLEVYGARNWRAFRSAEEKRLSTYGWMDRASGSVHIPIDRAMDLIAERGVAPLAPPPAPNAPPNAESKR